MAVSFSQAEIDAFRDFMLKNRGVTEMWIGDRHYKFTSLDEMQRHLAYMERNLATATPAPTMRVAQTSKGFQRGGRGNC
jgi:hypothetical protein